MKVLLLIKNFDFGGAENHVCELANELVKNGTRVWLFSGKGRQQLRLSPEVTHISARITEWYSLPLFFRLIALIKKEQIQVIHAHQRLPIWLATLVGLFTGTKVAGTIHGTALHDIRSSVVKRYINAIIVISQNSFAIHCRDPRLRDKLYFLPNCFRMPSGTEVQKLHKPPIKLYYVSRQDQRHVNLLVNIITNVWPRFLMKHPGSTFHLVGDGCGSGRISNILVARNAEPWMKSVVCEGYVDDTAVCLKDAHLVLGVGRVVGESLSHGVPALSIKWNHLGPILTRENFEELSYANFVSLKSAPPETEILLDLLEEFVNRSNYYQQEACFLQNIVAQKFDIRDGALKTIAVYNKLTNAR